MPEPKNDDPTRKKPGGSRAETEIARQSPLGSDNAGASRGAPKPQTGPGQDEDKPR